MKEKRRKGKKGVSQIIATVLLIGITIILAAIIFLWVMKFIGEQIEKFGEPAKDVCREQVILTAGLTQKGSGLEYYLDLDNKGNVAIYALDMKKYLEGRSRAERLNIPLGGGESTRTEILFDQAYEKITLTPVILGNVKGKKSRKPFICPEESAITVPLYE